jgi:hypothetical protein
MPKIKAIGNGFIQIEETLINLSQYKEIKKYSFGYDEDPDGKSKYGIIVTPLVPNEKSIKNGVDGSFMLTTYLENELSDFESDFDIIISVLEN